MEESRDGYEVLPVVGQAGAGGMVSGEKIVGGHDSEMLTSPVGGGGGIIAWLAMLLCLFLALGGLLWEVGHGDVFDSLEEKSLSVSIQTWEHRKDLGDEAMFSRLRLMPVLNGFEQDMEPPGRAWLDQVSFHLFASWPDTVGNMVHRARLVSVFFGLLLIGSVFWAGHSICGQRVGFLAALICMGNPLFLYYGRLATGTMPIASMIVFAIASGIWAIRPLRPTPSFSRQAIGWGMCGVGIGVAVLTGGGIGLPGIVLPLMVILLICPNRVDHVLGLLASVLLGALLVALWVIFTQHEDLRLLPSWLFQMMPDMSSALGQLIKLSGWRLLVFLFLFLPWSIWLVCAMFQAFSASSSGNRGKLFISWVWFVISLPLLMMETDHTSAYFLPIMSAAAILVALLFEQSNYLALQGRYIRVWRYFRWGHLFLMASCTIALPIVYYARSEGMSQVGEPFWFADVPWFCVVGGVVILGLLVFQCWRYVVGHHPFKSAVMGCLWMWICCLLLLWPLMHGPLARNKKADVVADLAGRVRGKVYWLVSDGHGLDQRGGSLLGVYLKNGMEPLTRGQLEEFKGGGEVFTVLTPLTFKASDAAIDAGAWIWSRGGEFGELGRAMWIVKRERSIKKENF